MAHGNTLTRFIYNYSPWILKNVISGYYGFSTSLKKYGKTYHEYLKYLQTSQWLNYQRKIEIRNQLLRNTVRDAVIYVPYYSELFKKLKLTSDDIQTPDDLTKLPILTKKDVVNHYERLLSKKYSLKKLITSRSSGTTGINVKITMSKESYQKEQAFIWSHREWGGVKRGEPAAVFSGHLVADLKRNRPPFWVKDPYENQIIFSSYHMSEKNLFHYAKQLIRLQPKFIWGYPSSVYLMASYMENEKITGVYPKAIFTSSETLYPFQRETIERVFHAKVLNYYANTERIVNIVECDQGGLHVRHQSGLIEFLNHDDKPVIDGEEARMICTGFVNDAMPLIRYDIGDIAVPINKTCECGREDQMVSEIVGRIDDYLITPDGRKIGRLDRIFKEIENVQEAQIIQENVHLLNIKIVKGKRYNQNNAPKIISKLQKFIGSNVEIHLQYVDHIPKLSNGKYRYVMSKCNTGGMN